MISTPNGQQGKFFELAQEAGLADGDPERAGIRDQGLGVRGQEKTGIKGQGLGMSGGRAGRWSGHWCDITKAVRQGLEIDLKLLRAGVDDETWRQEYGCEFLSGGSQWIPSELFERCVSAEASIGFEAFASADYTHDAQGSLQESASSAKSADSSLYAGWDVARSRDLSVIWLEELVGDVTWTRGVVEMRNLPTPDQIRQARALMPFIRRMEIDQSGMGLAIFESLAREFPGQVEGVQFTAAKKEALAVLAKRRLEESKVRLPDAEAVRESFRSVKKTSNALGQSRFDSEHDAKYGHGDHWWAFCLAEAAAEQASASGRHLPGVAALVGRPQASGLLGAAF